MNFNASVYCNAVPGLVEKYEVEERVARYGQMIFLVAYAFGCEVRYIFLNNLPELLNARSFGLHGAKSMADIRLSSSRLVLSTFGRFFARWRLISIPFLLVGFLEVSHRLVDL